MTARQIWEGMLVELSKVNAPSMLLEDFNYFINKAINQYINKRYNIYDINQQTTDDLRVLKATAILDVKESKEANTAIGQLGELGSGLSKLFGGTYETTLPSDYLHILNCICIYKVNETYKCYNKGNVVQFAAKRLTADAWSIIVNDYYNRPLPQRPYYYIHNINVNNDTTDVNNTIPTNPANSSNKYGTDVENTIDDVFPKSINLLNGKQNVSTVEKEAGIRYGNPRGIRMEIRYGQDNEVFELYKVLVDYIKAPQTIRLTQEQVNLTQDTSQIMEFPDYVCHEIINELTMLVMENTADPRLQTNTTVTQSIVNPAQQQTPQPQPQRG